MGTDFNRVLRFVWSFCGHEVGYWGRGGDAMWVGRFLGWGIIKG